jgi:hypothetical protein
MRSEFASLWVARDQLQADPERLVQARALMLCNLPYHRSDLRSVTRVARVGRQATLRVTFTSIDEGVPLAFGADRALLGWIQTRAYRDGFVAFNSLGDFFRDFGLGSSGRDYQRFRDRLRRIESLAITIRLDSPADESRVRLVPLKKARLPKDTGAEALTGPTPMIRSHRYGFELDPDFWGHLRKNPVPLPLPLMRLFHSRPMAWDLASFVVYRTYVAQSPSVVPWADILAQLGSADSNPRRLRSRLDRIIREICVAFPGFPSRFLPGYGGLRIEPWKAKVHARG